ncbi:polysaccharide deacetylase family protein [Paenibacillus arenilitoris]|uniref:Polysaccharide deacetylase family protein n=1 Tax=Paenibacillus arenilitoris TaxID=2772299 RepID=A0A927CQ06_9BACL|nr:polysaccharide deacetylase family protein [Paenibacillus arenilitoris]MBD2871614.1 polysaccharide deacetylase family protein [Paenibacillus arenilitoris]
MKKIILGMLALQLAWLHLFAAGASAAANRHEAEARLLNELGLFEGTEAGLELDRRLTRAEGAVMLVRLIGKEKASLTVTEPLPYRDVPQWAYPAVAYLHASGLINGISAGQFGSSTYITASQYATMMARALGYREDRGDFKPNQALGKLVQLNVIPDEKNKELSARTFTRGDVAWLSYHALQAPLKETGKTLAQQLIEQGVIAYEAAMEAGLIDHAPVLLEDSGGIRVTRPSYGTLNVVIRRGELYAPLAAEYASAALRTYDETVRYEQAAAALKNGSFDYGELLRTGRLTDEHPVPGDQSANRFYSRPLTLGASPLLDRDTQRQFGYVLVFYDDRRKPVYYMHEKLPLLETKLSSSPKIAALMYHHFSEKEEQSSVTVHPERLRSQLRALKAEGYVPIRQQDLLAFLQGDQQVKLPEKSVILTIDDGYESNYELAYPILAEEGFYATIFVISSFRGRTPGVIPHFSWEKALEMYRSGFIDIHNHTFDAHFYGRTAGGKGPALTSRLYVNDRLETKAEYEKRIFEDLRQSRSMIEKNVGNRVFALSYPYGSYNRSVIAAAVSTGHSLMYTTREGLIRKGTDPYALPRINVDGGYSAEDLLHHIQSFH